MQAFSITAFSPVRLLRRPASPYGRCSLRLDAGVLAGLGLIGGIDVLLRRVDEGVVHHVLRVGRPKALLRLETPSRAGITNRRLPARQRPGGEHGVVRAGNRRVVRIGLPGGAYGEEAEACQGGRRTRRVAQGARAGRWMV